MPAATLARMSSLSIIKDTYGLSGQRPSDDVIFAKDHKRVEVVSGRVFRG
jgi:hypothetical protein